MTWHTTKRDIPISDAYHDKGVFVPPLYLLVIYSTSLHECRSQPIQKFI